MYCNKMSKFNFFGVLMNIVFIGSIANVSYHEELQRYHFTHSKNIITGFIVN